MNKYNSKIEEIWQTRHQLTENTDELADAKRIINEVIQALDLGIVRICEKKANEWHVNEWLKKAVMLNFQFSKPNVYSSNCVKWFDKIPPKFDHTAEIDQFVKIGCRIAPGAFIRKGAYLAKNVIAMPSFVNIGAYVDEGTMIDTWASIGSCAQIGKNCHISGGAGIGGVLEPIQASPVIIEDNCFIGARSEIVEGVIVEEGAVISMGVFIGASTKIVDRNTGEITYGKVPAYSVIVPGTLPNLKNPELPSLYCAVKVKTVDASTRSKTSINELLRY